MTKPTSTRSSTTPTSKQSVRAKKAAPQDASATRSKKKAYKSTKVHKSDGNPVKAAVARPPAKKAAPARKAPAKAAKPKPAAAPAPVPPVQRPRRYWTAAAPSLDVPHETPPVTISDLVRDGVVHLSLEPAPAKPLHDPAVHERPSFRPTVERFIDEYMLSLNATDAYQKAHPVATRATCQVEGSRTLANPMVAAEVARRQQELRERTGVTLEKLVKRLWAIARANPDELTSWRIGACRHCWGLEHRWQRTDAEYERDFQAFEQAGELPPRKRRKNESQADYERWKRNRGDWDAQGGNGFDPKRAPHPDCPECFGEGHGRMVLGDTRHLSEEARALFAGVRETKEGLEIKQHDQLAALDKLMRHLGGYEKDNKQKGVGELAALIAGFNKAQALPVVPEVPRDELS